jgi:hypothetical protein
MSRQAAGRSTRPLIEMVDEAISIVRQDAAEYGYIALIGGVSAAIAVLIPGIIGTPASLALIGPLVTITAVLTFATATAAVGAASGHMQPDASRALAEVAQRLPAVLFPWLLLAVGSAIASFVAATFTSDLGPVPSSAPLILVVIAAIFYVLPRSLCAHILLEHDATWRQSEIASTRFVRGNGRRVQTIWAICCAPALATALLGLLAGIDAVVGALIALMFVGALPFASTLFSLLMFEITSNIEAPLDERRSSASAIQRRI